MIVLNVILLYQILIKKIANTEKSAKFSDGTNVKSTKRF